MPQILMLNHASWATHKRVEAKVKRDRQEEDLEEDQPVYKGKKLEELDSSDWKNYYSEMC